MVNSSLRKYIRKKMEEYGNFAFSKVNVYPDSPNKFPKFDKEHPKTPEEIDFWNDLENQEEITEEDE